MSAEIKHAIDRLRYKMPTRSPFREFRPDILLVCDAAEATLSLAQQGRECPKCARHRQMSAERKARSQARKRNLKKAAGKPVNVFKALLGAKASGG